MDVLVGIWEGWFCSLDGIGLWTCMLDFLDLGWGPVLWWWRYCYAVMPISKNKHKEKKIINGQQASGSFWAGNARFFGLCHQAPVVVLTILSYPVYGCQENLQYYVILYIIYTNCCDVLWWWRSEKPHCLRFTVPLSLGHCLFIRSGCP